ncbi:MAG TPA: ankyrin repeat domain-containing protein [Pirellulales bacterium]|nr:ankyrin repeat domain-containing protein [Pirellulales bacterium]
MTYDVEAGEWTAKRKFPELADFRIPPSRKRRTSSFEVSVVAENREEPSAEQAKAYTWLLAHEASVCRKVLRAIARYYSWLRQEDRAWFDDYECHEVKTVDDLRDLMEFDGLFVRRDQFRGLALLGFSFACKWDDEHGLGVLTHRGQIIDAGQAEVAYREPTKASSMWLRLCTARERSVAVEVIKAINKPSRRRGQPSGERGRGEAEEADALRVILHDRLVSAVLRGDRKGAEKLLQQGADINFVGWPGVPALFKAVGDSNVEAVRWMIDAGAALDVECFGSTLLEKARSKIETIGWRPDLRLRADQREHYESWHNRAVEVLRILEAAGAR